ncbi:MAG: O-antigen ligase family protein [Chthoniobacteraceae bacterium]|jgi:hypothetical protein
MPPITRFVVESARWLFLAALVCAPWVYGSTPAWAIAMLEALLALILALWLTGCLLRKLKPSIHPVLLGCTAVILLFGAWMTLNPHFRQTANYQFAPVHPRIPWAPGTVDAAASLAAMVRVACILGIVCFVCDLSARREWRRRVWRAIAITGVSLVLFGLLQSAFARPILVWNPEDIGGIPYFATYYYHGNAGSFINLVLPFIAGLAALTMRKPDAHFARAIWLPGFFICVAGAFVNLSRSGTVITMILCVLLVVWQFHGQARDELLPRRRLRVAYAVLMAAAVICLVAFSGWERPAEKWALLRSQLNSSNKRAVAVRICMRMLPDARWHGFGPGTFALVFPHYTGADAKLIPGIWRYAHNDYLQCLLEWGWFGSIFWAVLLFGALARLFIYWRKRRDFGTADHVLAFVSALALAGVAAHALVDFPLQIASLQLYAAVCAGFGWGISKWEGAVPRTT